MPSTTKPQDRVTSHRIADLLRASILSGQLAPGERIRQEELADQFETSRIPVREALRMMSAEGLVTLVANAGAWVSRLSEVECSDVYQIRERLDPLLLRMSIPNLAEDTIEHMADLADQMERNRDVETFLRLDREFHLASYTGAPKGVLSEMVERLWNTTQHYRRTFTQLVGLDGIAITHLEHHLLVDAVRRRDPDDGERFLTSHIRRTRLALMNHKEVFSVD